MPAEDNEKTAFAERLKSALKRAPKISVQTASELAHHFNLRYRGDPVTAQAAAKWLTGKAFPSRDKLETLAEMLGVSAYWLKNGSPPPRKATKKTTQTSSTGQLSDAEGKLISRLRTLSEHQVYLVVELVEQIAIERELSGGSSYGESHVVRRTLENWLATSANVWATTHFCGYVKLSQIERRSSDT